MARVKSNGSYIPTGPLGGDCDVMDLCAGPGGWDVGAQILGLRPMVGVELDWAACATGRAAGHIRHQVDMRHLDPATYFGVHGCVISPPCPTFSKGGLRTGIADMQLAADTITCLGNGCGYDCDWFTLPDRVTDPRTALVVEAARWVLRAPDLEWFVAEQVPSVEYLWEDLVAELSEEWAYTNVVTLDAADFGVPSHRKRTFLIARRYRPGRVGVEDAARAGITLPPTTMAQALGWKPGTKVWTRGNRTTSGGNGFSADEPSWCLTGSSRSWEIGHVGGPLLTPAQAGLLNGFRTDYPWQGSRTAQFGQIADVVSPVVAAVVLGTATDTPWVEPVQAYLNELYATAGVLPGMFPAIQLPAPRRSAPAGARARRHTAGQHEVLPLFERQAA